MGNIKITTLVENTVPMSPITLLGEHGLSFYIESKTNKILFDTGQGMVLSGNAKGLKIDLAGIDTIVLSHGHFDHTGGVKNLIGHNRNFTLIAHPAVFENKLVARKGNYFPIGIPVGREEIENSGIKLILEKNSVEIAPGIITTAEIPLQTNFEKVMPTFFQGKDGEEVQDTIPDDRAMIIDSENGSIVILGCSHRGIINTLNHVNWLTKGRKIHAILGGLHLMFATENKINKIASHLEKFGVEKMILGHCTGFLATSMLFNIFKGKVIPNIVGNVIEF